MSEASHGYPFLIQLVGAQTWRVHPTARSVSVEDARRGVEDARRRLASLVHEPALAAASEVDRAFLAAMAQDDGPSRMLDVRKRLGVSDGYASQYRLRLHLREQGAGPPRR